MKHYHGTPLGGTRASVAEFLASRPRFFLVPFGRDEDLPIASAQSCGFVLDNGAYTHWKRGQPITDWSEYYRWCLEWHQSPRFDFAIIPDVIDGTEDENNLLFAEWFKRCKAHCGWVNGAPVWHMHESLDRLQYLLDHADIVCLGSSGQYATIGTDSWHHRMSEAMQVLCDDSGRPKCRIHGLRMLSADIVERYPFASCDSTNVAQNSQLLTRYGMYTPPTQSQRREVLASRIEATISPSAWNAEHQHSLFALSDRAGDA